MSSRWGVCPRTDGRRLVSALHAEHARFVAEPLSGRLVRLRPILGSPAPGLPGPHVGWNKRPGQVQRGDVAAPDTGAGSDAGPHARARAAATTFAWLADGLRVAA